MSGFIKYLRYSLLVVIAALNVFLVWFLYGIFYPNASIAQSVGISLAIVAGFLLLAVSPVGEAYFSFMAGMRDPSADEAFYLMPIFTEVLTSANYGEVKIKVRNMAQPNAWACGHNTICLTTGLISQATRRELFGVVAHEVGHLVNGDSMIMLIAAVLNSVGTWATIAIAAIILFFGQFLDAMVPGWKWVVLLEVSIIKGIAWCAFKILDLVMLYTCRQQEYAADKFAAKVGYRDGLVAFLWRISRQQRQTLVDRFSPKEAMIAALTDTHPPTLDRLRALGVQVD